MSETNENEDLNGYDSSLVERVDAPNGAKVVKFEADEEEKEDARRDGDRSRPELLAKIERLTRLLAVSHAQESEEKDKRKKKEKNLMKLAKELKKRNAQRDIDADRMEEVSPSIADLAWRSCECVSQPIVHRHFLVLPCLVSRTAVGREN